MPIQLNSELIEAVMDENVEAVMKLLLRGTNPNAFEDQDRIRPLHFVAQKKSEAALKIAKLLMAYGADPHLPNHPDGQTALDIAYQMSSPEMCTLLRG